MWSFIKAHVWPSILGVTGAFLVVVGYVNSAWTLFNAGLPNEIWQAVGAVVFFAAVIAVLVRQHSTAPASSAAVSETAYSSTPTSKRKTAFDPERGKEIDRIRKRITERQQALRQSEQAERMNAQYERLMAPHREKSAAIQKDIERLEARLDSLLNR